MEHKSKLLIVDDETIHLRNLKRAMIKEGYDVTTTSSGVNALKILKKQEFDIVLTDLIMEKVDGVQILTRCRELYPDSEVIIITGHASLPSAVETVKKGAYSYLAKPIKLDEVRRVVREALDKVHLKRENTRLREQMENCRGQIRTIRPKEERLPSLQEQELEYIKSVLKEVGGNRTLAARILGIDRVSLWRKLKKYGLENE